MYVYVIDEPHTMYGSYSSFLAACVFKALSGFKTRI